MLTRVLRAALPAVLAAMLGPRLAHADIYTWVDPSGTINVSNLAPPDGAQVTKILHASAPATASREDAARDAARRAETDALAARVQQLEAEVERASSPVMLPPMEYRAVPAPPVVQYVQYVVEQAPPIVPYAVNAAPSGYAGCDPTWISCGLWWAPGFYPASVVVLRAPNFRPFHPARGGHNFALQQPVHPPGGLRKG